MFNQLENNSFGLDISDGAIRLVQLKKRGKKISLSSFNELKIPPDIINNGEIKNPEKLVGSIKQLIESAKGKKIKTKNAVVVLPESKTFIKVVDMPTVNKSEIQGAIQEEVKHHIPLQPEEIYFDWQIIKSTPQTTKLLIGAAPKEIVDSYFIILEKSGLKPAIFEIEAAVIIRSIINREQKDEKKAKIIIDFGAVRTGLIIYDDAFPQLTVSLPISGNKINQTIAKTLNLDSKKAEKAKIICGLDPQKCDGAIIKILNNSIDKLVIQIKKATMFYKSNFPGGNEISEIVLCGGGANFSQLDKVLSDKLKIPVKVANPVQQIAMAKRTSIPQNKILSYTTAIGLALRAFQKNNL